MKQNIQLYNEFNINNNRFFADGHINNSHRSEDQRKRKHIFLDFDLSDKENSLTTHSLKSIVEEMKPILEKTNAYGVLFTGNGIHIEYLFDINTPIKYGHRYKELYKELVSEYTSIISHFGLKVDYACDLIYKLDRVPGSINPKNGKTVEWLWLNEEATIDHKNLTGIKIITKENDTITYINQDKLSFIRSELNTKRKDKTEIYSKGFMQELVSIMYKYVYGENVNTNKSFKCVLHEEKHASAFIEKNRYFDYHVNKGKSKSVLDVFFSFITDEDVIIHEDAYAKFFHLIIDSLKITFENNASLYKRVENRMNDANTIVEKQLKRKPLFRALTVIKETVLYNILHNDKNEFMLSERFLAENSIMDNATANKITQLLVASGFMKRKYVHVKGKRVELKDFVNDGSVYFTYIYEINNNMDLLEWVSILKNVLSKISIKMVSKKALSMFFNTDMILGRSDGFPKQEITFVKKDSKIDIQNRFNAFMKIFRTKISNVFKLDDKIIYSIS